MIKIFKKGTFVIIENTVSGERLEIVASECKIYQPNSNTNLYDILENDVVRLKSVALATLVDENDAAYTSTSFDDFRLAIRSEAAAAPTSEYTDVVVDISSAQILSMGTSPVQLLPSPGAGKYYEYRVSLEYTHVSTAYSLTDNVFIGDQSSDFCGTVLAGGFLSGTVNRRALVDSNSSILQGTILAAAPSKDSVTVSTVANQPLLLTTWYNTDPTLGDGTIKAKISYKVVTFG